MPETDRFLIFIPTYNEQENVGMIYIQIRALDLPCDILFLDDNSPDGTGEALDGIAETDRSMRVIHRSGKLGIGSAHQEGVRYAYEHGYRTLLTMDSDFTHAPADIPLLLAAAESADIVVASRFLKKNSLSGWTLLRKGLTWTGHALTITLLGMKYDATGAFRVYRLDRIPKEIFSLIESRGYSFFFESLYLLHFNRFRIQEVAIDLPPRTYGHSKMNFVEVRRSASILFETILRRIFRKNSMQLGVSDHGQGRESVQHGSGLK